MSRRLAPTPDREQRTVTRTVELRAAGDASAPGTLTGYAAVFDSRSEVMQDWWYGAFREQINPGAFAGAIERDDVRCLQDHLSHIVLGRNTAGTLRLSEDDTGLAIENDLPDTQAARDLSTLMRRGDVNQMSFAFRVINGAEEWSEDADGMPLRQINEVRLYDVSVVTYPAYTATSAQARAMAPTLEQVVAVALDEERRAVAFPELREGQALTTTNRSLVERAVGALRSLLDDDQDVQDEQRQAALMREHRARELDLLERSLRAR